MFRSRYIIYETKTKGKKYDRYIDELIFEGEYLNGKRHGKGKEYWEDIEFEGEYLNGKRHGKGKEYNYKGEIIFTFKYYFTFYIIFFSFSIP